MVRRYRWDRVLGVGVLDVKTADRMLITPDCGLRHLTAGAARAKLHNMTVAAATVRDRLEKETPA